MVPPSFGGLGKFHAPGASPRAQRGVAGRSMTVVAASHVSAAATNNSTVGAATTTPLAVSPQIGKVTIMTQRVAQLEEVVASVKEISAQGSFDDVIARILSAVKKLVRADKYTLGILNERRNVIDIFSSLPRTNVDGDNNGELKQSDASTPAARFVNEGFVAADSPTTFGRVIMTGKPLGIEDFYTHENYEYQMKISGISPHALLCLPIRNANRAVVGVFQVVSMAKKEPNKEEKIEQESNQRPGNPNTKLKHALGSSRQFPLRFTDMDRKNLEFLAVVAGSAIWHLVLSRERQTAQNRIEGLLKLHRNISMEAVSSVVLDQVLSVCHELIGTERIGLFLKMDGEDELYIASAADIVRGEYVPITKGIVGHVARTGETIITNDAYSHPMFDSTLDQKTGFLTKRILCLPVKSPDGAILAVLSAVNKVDGTDFSNEDSIFLNYAADAVGISLHKASLLHEVRTSQKLIGARLALATFLSEREADVAAFVDLVMSLGKDIMACDSFGLLLIDHFKKELWITPKIGGESIRSPMNRGISGLVATTGELVCTRDAYTHPLFDPSVDTQTGYRTISVLCMPVFEDHGLSSRKVVAVAMCINKKEADGRVVAFTRGDRETMRKFCSEVQFALGRLALDIYYKVVSDCVASGSTDSSAAATPASTLGSSKSNKSLESSRSLKRLASSRRLDTPPNFSETDIISSIVHKYCYSSSNGASSGNTTNQEPPSLSLVTSSAQRKEQHTAEDDMVPFPREISFAQGHDEPLDKWDTDTTIYSSGDIAMCCGIVFRAYGFLESLRISSDKFAAFTTNVANYYRSNPFHNFQHAFQVLLALHVMIRTECRRFFSGIEIFAMLLAALCHDIDHPGNSNEFELRTLSPLALTHDDAVLERHHCRVTFIILNHKSAKILQHLDADRYRRVRALVISCILATNMGKHFDKCRALETLTRRALPDKSALLMGVLLHAADLSHQALPFAQSAHWGARLLDEFHTQARAESELGLPSDFFMHDLARTRTRLAVQLHFINYIVRPIWLPLASLCPHLRVRTHDREWDIHPRSWLEACDLPCVFVARDSFTPTRSSRTTTGTGRCWMKKSRARHQRHRQRWWQLRPWLRVRSLALAVWVRNPRPLPATSTSH